MFVMLKTQFVVVEDRETVRVCSVEKDEEAPNEELFQAVRIPPAVPFAGLICQESRRRGRKECRLS
jgi:hypothetical protein